MSSFFCETVGSSWLRPGLLEPQADALDSDLARKHYKSHTNTEIKLYEQAIAESLQDSGQARDLSHGEIVPMACVACARTKAKCDLQNPCGRCSTRKIKCQPRTKIRPGDGVGSTLSDTSLSAEVDLIREENQSKDSPSTARQEDSESLSSGRDNALHIQPEHDSTDTADEVQAQTPPANESGADQSSRGTIAGLIDAPMSMNMYPPLLPQLDWQTLASISALRTEPNPGSQFPTRDEMDHSVMEKPDWSTVQDATADFAQSFLPYSDSLFAFNADQSSWQSSSSALDRIMVDCLVPLEFVEPPVGNGPILSSPVQPDDRAESSPTNWQSWSPIDLGAASNNIDLGGEPLEKWPFGHCSRDMEPDVTSPGTNGGCTHHVSMDTNTWSCAIERYRDSCYEAHERISNVDLTDDTRDRMLLVAQNLIRTSMKSQDAKQLSGILSADQATPERCLLLPPKASIQKYLDIFLTTFEPFIPMIPALALDPNKLACQDSEREATLLLFLMIACGSMLDPAPRARQFSKELTEVCRASLRSVTDIRDVSREDILTMHCGLIFTVQTSFSGRQSHMVAGATQRHFYIAVGSSIRFCRNMRG